MVLPPDSEQLLVYYLIWICRRQQISRYSLGRSSLGTRRKLDDVSLELFDHEKRHRYLFSIHQRHYIKKNISYEALMGSSGDFSLVRWFDEYLKLKPEIESCFEITVWTEATFRKRDLEVQQMVELVEEGSGMPDLLENGLLGVRRYRIKSSEQLEEKLLKSVDPLYKLAEKIARLLLAKLPIGPRNTSNEAFSWLIEHVFDKSCFKNEFLDESSILSEETKLFRSYLETLLHQQFQRKQIADFQLSRIVQPPFSAHVEIHLKDHSITRDSQKRGWNFQNTITIADARSFLASLVCYTNVPTAQIFEKMIHQRCSFNEDICIELRRFFNNGIKLSETQINAIFELDEFRKNKPLWMNDTLQFKLERLSALEAKLIQFSVSNTTRLIVVEAGGSIRLTLDRISRVAEELLPSRRFIFIKDSRRNQLDKLLSILEALESVIVELPVVIVPYNNVEISLSEINRITKLCQAVLVVDDSNAIEVKDFTIHKDDYTFEDFSSDTKDDLLSKSVFLQGRKYLLSSLLGELNLTTIPMEAVIDWDACERIILGSLSYTKEQLNSFIERELSSESVEVLNFSRNNLNCIVILSGEPGAGKSFILEKMALECQHKHCVSILLNCRTKSKLFEQIEDVLEVLFKLLEIKNFDNFQKFLLKTLVEEKRIHLFLDDFDEVCKYKATLKWIQDLGFHSVVISVRPHLEDFLKTNLTNSVVRHLKPFNESDQLNFLKNRWKNVYSDQKQLENVLQNFRMIFDENFLKIPLNLKIAAKIYEGNDFTIITKNVAKIVKVFIDKKFSLHCEQFFNVSCRAHEIALKTLRTSFEQGHAELAFELECGQEVDQETMEKLYPFGLLRYGGGKVAFVDYVFQEYYLVEFLLTRHVEQKYFSQFMGKLFGCSRSVDFLDHHIASVDSKRDPLGKPKVLECLRSKPLRPNQKLGEIKVEQFYNFFCSCSERQLNSFINSSIVNTKFNVFEVIYDSLPINLYNNIKFKFSSTDANPKIIDLSFVTEANLVILLEILSKKHPVDIIEQVIANFTTEEPDFVTTAIKNGYKQVIEQLFRINQSLNSQEEVERLQDYIEQRWSEYLNFAVVDNRIEIVEIVLSCIGKKYHQRVIKAFLMEQLVLHALAGVCQHVDESALDIVQLVLQFVEDNLSRYDLSSMKSRKFYGSSLRELLDKISGDKLRDIFEKML